jgi:hypothetical protein
MAEIKQVESIEEMLEYYGNGAVVILINTEEFKGAIKIAKALVSDDMKNFIFTEFSYSIEKEF